MAGIAATRPVIFTAPSSRKASAPITWKPTTGHALPPSTVPTPYHPTGTTSAPRAPRSVQGGKLCAGGCGTTDQGLGSPPFPIDQIARNPAGPIGSSSGITNPTPVNRAGMTDFGSGILKNSVATSPPLVSVAAPPAPETTKDSTTAIVLGVGALVVLVVGVAVLT